MNKLHLILATALVAGATAWSAPDVKRTLKSANADLDRGHTLLAEASRKKANGARLDALDRAIGALRLARREALEAGDGDERIVSVQQQSARELARALDAKAEIYLGRGSMKQASEAATAALVLVPDDSRASNILYAANSAKDVYDDQGATSIGRIRDRRAGSGMPLRDRGTATRR